MLGHPPATRGATPTPGTQDLAELGTLPLAAPVSLTLHCPSYQRLRKNSAGVDRWLRPAEPYL